MKARILTALFNWLMPRLLLRVSAATTENPFGDVLSAPGYSLRGRVAAVHMEFGPDYAPDGWFSKVTVIVRTWRDDGVTVTKYHHLSAGTEQTPTGRQASADARTWALRYCAENNLILVWV